MKALSIQQPWAWLIVNGHKGVENRTWDTRYRGPLAIHAGKQFDSEGYDWVRRHHPEVPLPHRDSFQRGGIVGVATLSGIVTRSADPWFFGPFGFLLDDAKPTAFQPMRGALGLFEAAYAAPASATREEGNDAR